MIGGHALAEILDLLVGCFLRSELTESYFCLSALRGLVHEALIVGCGEVGGDKSNGAENGDESELTEFIHKTLPGNISQP
jgi:hypothetical protein